MIDLTKFTHEQNQAILEYGNFLISELKTLSIKCPKDVVGLEMAILTIQTNTLVVQTNDILQLMKGDIVKEAEKIARGE